MPSVPFEASKDESASAAVLYLRLDVLCMRRESGEDVRASGERREGGEGAAEDKVRLFECRSPSKKAIVPPAPLATHHVLIEVASSSASVPPDK